MAIIDCWDFNDLGADNATINAIMLDIGFIEADAAKQQTDAAQGDVATGRGAMQISGSLRYKTPGTQATLGISANLRLGTTIPTAAIDVVDFEFEDGADNVQVKIKVDLNNGVYATLADNSLIGSHGPASTVLLNHFQHWQILVTCDDTVGAIEVRIGGVVALNLTGVDTKSESSTTINQISFEKEGIDNWIDDLIVFDTTGGQNDDFFPVGTSCVEITVDAAGDDSDWTPSAGANEDNVDDADVPDDDTTINETDTNTNKDTFNMTALPAGVDTVHAVKAEVYARREVAGTSDLQIIQKTGGTSANSGSKTLATTYGRHSYLRETSPDTSAAWTVAEVDAMLVGYELVA